METASPHVLGKLDVLRAELTDLAFALERRGRLDAADVANAASARIGELRDELDAHPARRRAGAGPDKPSV